MRISESLQQYDFTYEQLKPIDDGLRKHLAGTFISALEASERPDQAIITVRYIKRRVALHASIDVLRTSEREVLEFVGSDLAKALLQL